MMFMKSTFKMTYIGEISTQILVLPYVGQEINMVILLPSESTDLNTVTGHPWPWGPGSRPDPCQSLGSGNSCAAGRPPRARRVQSVGHSRQSLVQRCCRP